MSATMHQTLAALLSAAREIVTPEIRERAIANVLACARRHGVVLEIGENENPRELEQAGAK